MAAPRTSGDRIRRTDRLVRRFAGHRLDRACDLGLFTSTVVVRRHGGRWRPTSLALLGFRSVATHVGRPRRCTLLLYRACVVGGLSSSAAPVEAVRANYASRVAVRSVRVRRCEWPVRGYELWHLGTDRSIWILSVSVFCGGLLVRPRRRGTRYFRRATGVRPAWVSVRRWRCGL